MKKIHAVLGVILLSSTGISSFGQGIIPAPFSVKPMEGSFRLSAQTHVHAPKELMDEAAALKLALNLASGSEKGHSKNMISGIDLALDASLAGELGAEGYRLRVSPERISITAPNRTGVFYGIQSLRQLAVVDEGLLDKGKTISAQMIEDKPRFARRMLMLDEGRHFKGVKVVKNVLREMAVLKINTLHWHLTDDQGWRVQIRKYPLLTEIGSKRDSTEISGWDAEKKTFDHTPKSGFYTQDQIKEIVAYAAGLHIEVIPELDMPGHSSAAIAAYPWLSAEGKQIAVPGYWGVLKNVYNVADPKVIAFLHDVLDEVMALFPSKIVHIGGDEVDYSSWKNSKMVQYFMKDKGIAVPSDLQMWFTNQVSAYLTSKGKRMMGWNDIMGHKLFDHLNTDGGDYGGSIKPASGTLVHFWQGDQALLKQVLDNGFEVVNAFNENAYFNYPMSRLTLKKAYIFEPVPDGMRKESQSRVVGVSCHLWSEYIPDEQTLNRHIYPRIAASAEVGWSAKANKNYDSFISRMVFFYQRWKGLGIVPGVETEND